MPSARDLPLAKGERHVKAFKRFGWKRTRVNGSHHILEKEGMRPSLSIPCNNKDVKRHLIHEQLKLAGISTEEYLKAFK